MKINGDSKYFLKLSLIFLIISIFLPHSIGSIRSMVFYNPGPTWPSGVPTSQTYKTWTFHWSFLNVKTTVPYRDPHYYDYLNVGTTWMFLHEYWNFYPLTTSVLLGAIFALQIILILLFRFTLKTTTSLNLLLIFLGVTLLLIFYLGTSYQFASTPGFGFWILIPATLFTSIVLIRTKKRT